MKSPGQQTRFDAIVIGASAGGVDILSRLLPALPAALRCPVLIVLHLPPDRDSLLTQVFARRCVLRVKEAEDKEALDAGTVYFAPPDYHLLVERGPVVALSHDEPDHYSRPSIDALFESAADVFGAQLLAIVLSGASQDGASGLATVTRCGGTALVQDPSTAQATTMPAAALDKSASAHVLTPAGMADFLSKLT